MTTSGYYSEQDSFNLYLISMYSLFGLPNTYYTDEFWSKFSNRRSINILDDKAINVIKKLYINADFRIMRKSSVGRQIDIDEASKHIFKAEIYLPNINGKGYRSECIEFKFDYDYEKDLYWLKSDILKIQLPYYLTGIYFETLFTMLVSFVNAITFNINFENKFNDTDNMGLF